jgi:hypothetical protein
MKADERNIGNVLTQQICYEIPPYQRPYSWNTENVQQLLEDVWEAYNGNDPEYFIGSLITIEKQKDLRYEVVDGQQRLTTLNLIFARLQDHVAEAGAKAALEKRILPRNELTGEVERPDCSCAIRIKAFSVATYSNQSPCRPSKISTPRSSASLKTWDRSMLSVLAKASKF